MKAKKIILLTVLFLSMAVTACSKKENAEETTKESFPITTEAASTETVAEVSTEAVAEEETERIIDDVAEIDAIVSGLDYAKPSSLGTVKVADLSSIQVEKAEIIAPTDEQLDEYIKNYVLPKYREKASGPVADNDYVIMNLLSNENGGAYDFEYMVGSNLYTEAFDRSLLGKNIGDKYDAEVTFPADFFLHNFAGKNVIFHVDITGINRIPELSNELVKEIDGSSSVDEYRKKLKDELTQLKEADYETERGYEAISELIAVSEFNIPEEAISWKANMLIKGYDETEKTENSTFGNLVVNTWNEDYNCVRNDLEQIGENALKRTLVIETIAKGQGITVTETDLKEFYIENGIEDASVLSDQEKEEIKAFILEEKVAEYLNKKI